MQKKTEFTPEQLHFLRLLGKQYPTVQAAGAEIINLQAIMNLPKGTEHFISDIHGEYEAFLHLLNSCSGVIREKLDELFATTLSQHDRNELATLIYYPEEKLALVAEEAEDLDEWYRITLYRLLELCRFLASKYTRSKVRHALPQGYADVIDELLHIRYEEPDKRDYFMTSSSAPSLISARPPRSSRPSARSSSGWRWTICTSSGIFTTAAPGRMS